LLLAALGLMNDCDDFYSEITCHVNQAVFTYKQLTYRKLIAFWHYPA